MKEIFIKLNGTDFSSICNELKIGTQHNFESQTNARGNTVVDFINTKREIEVGFIPLDNEKMKELQGVLNHFTVNVSFLSPVTGAMQEANCIVETNEVEYYTIQAGKVMFNAFTIKFEEL